MKSCPGNAKCHPGKSEERSKFTHPPDVDADELTAAGSVLVDGAFEVAEVSGLLIRFTRTRLNNLKPGCPGMILLADQRASIKMMPVEL